jgi:ABC-2 type transport system ATP-binding protein
MALAFLYRNGSKLAHLSRTMDKDMIELDNIHLSYRSGFLRLSKKVLNAISFKTTTGSVTGYLGVNGAGKTSTIKLIAGINKPNSGTIKIFGGSPYSAEVRNKIGYLPENPYFYEYLTPREALDLYGKLHQMDRAHRKKRTEELLERTEMAEYGDQQVRGFSKGMRQRLGLAQALIHDPQLLLLDEPLTGLDPMGRLLLRDIITSESKNGRTVFFSSHVLSDVEAICDSLIILNSGQIAFAGALSELLGKIKTNGVRLRFLCSEALSQNILDLPWLEKPEKQSRGYEGKMATMEQGQNAVKAIQNAGFTLLAFQPLGVSLEEYFLHTFGAKASSEKTAIAGKEKA